VLPAHVSFWDCGIFWKKTVARQLCDCWSCSDAFSATPPHPSTTCCQQKGESFSIATHSPASTLYPPSTTAADPLSSSSFPFRVQSQSSAALAAEALATAAGRAASDVAGAPLRPRLGHSRRHNAAAAPLPPGIGGKVSASGRGSNGQPWPRPLAVEAAAAAVAAAATTVPVALGDGHLGVKASIQAARGTAQCQPDK